MSRLPMGTTPTVVVPFRLTGDELEAFDAELKAAGITRSEFLRKSVQKWTRARRKIRSLRKPS